jgi:hypothetical protein
MYLLIIVSHRNKYHTSHQLQLSCSSCRVFVFSRFFFHDTTGNFVFYIIKIKKYNYSLVLFQLTLFIIICVAMFAVRLTHWSVITTFSSLLRWVWHFKYWLAHLLTHIISLIHFFNMGINSSISSHKSSVPVPPPFSQSWPVTIRTTGTPVTTRKTENVKRRRRRMSAFDRFYFPLTSALVACLTIGAECAGEIRIL